MFHTAKLHRSASTAASLSKASADVASAVPTSLTWTLLLNALGSTMPGKRASNSLTMCFFPSRPGSFLISDVDTPCELASGPPARLQHCAPDIMKRQLGPVFPFSFRVSAAGMICSSPIRAGPGRTSAIFRTRENLSRCRQAPKPKPNRSSAAVNEWPRPFNARKRAGFYYVKCLILWLRALDGMCTILRKRRVCEIERTINYPLKPGCRAPDETGAISRNVDSPARVDARGKSLQPGFPGFLRVCSILGSRSAGLHPASPTGSPRVQSGSG